MPRSKRDKTTGLPIPSPVVPATSICLRILVPNALEYRSALKGALSSLGQAWTWSQTEGEDNQASYEAAELWRSRLQDAIYTLDCGEEPMECEDVADCIDTSEAVRTAIQSVVPYTPIDGMVYPPGAPLTPSQMTAALNVIDECAFDPYWAQVEQYVDFMVNLGQDVLEQIAAYSAALDAGENVPMGTFLGKLKNTSTAGKVVEFLQWALTVVKAQYEAADNAENRRVIKCDIFCGTRDECLISIQGTLDILNNRLGGLLTPGDLTDLPSMVTAFTTATFNPALALDLWILFLMGSAKTAGMFGLAGIDETIQMVLAAAVNDANNDWVTLCDDCDEPPPGICEGGTSVDWREGENGFSIAFGRATYYPSEGWGLGGGWTSRCSIEGPFSPTPTIFKFTSFRESQTVRLLAIPSGSLVGQTTVGIDNGDGTFTYEIDTLVSPTATMYVDCGSTVLDSDYRMMWACWNYE